MKEELGPLRTGKNTRFGHRSVNRDFWYQRSVDWHMSKGQDSSLLLETVVGEGPGVRDLGEKGVVGDPGCGEDPGSGAVGVQGLVPLEGARRER